MNIRKLLLLALLPMLLNACGDTAQADTHDTPASATAQTVVAPRTNLLEDRTALQTAQTRLRELPLLAGKPIQVFGNIDFFDGVRPRIELSVENPQQSGKLLFLRYENNQWQNLGEDELPEEIPKAQFQRHLTPLEQIHFEDVVHVANTWREKAQATQAVIQDPYHVAFIWMPKLKKRFWHTAELEAVGAQYYLSVNLDGTVWEFKKL